MRPNATVKVVMRTQSVVHILIFLDPYMMDIHGMASGNSATGPLTKIAQNILSPEQIPDKQDKPL